MESSIVREVIGVDASLFGGESQVGEEDDTGTTDATMSGGDSQV